MSVDLAGDIPVHRNRYTEQAGGDISLDADPPFLRIPGLSSHNGLSLASSPLGKYRARPLHPPLPNLLRHTTSRFQWPARKIRAPPEKPARPVIQSMQ